jgi:hypothetical protein
MKGMEFLLALQYPNGRIHETVYDTERVIVEPGAEFEMYGHTWRVVGFLEQHHIRSDSRAKQPPRMLCVTVDSLRATG